MSDRPPLSLVAGDPAPPPHLPPPAPFEVRLRRGVGGTMIVVGHDRSGAPLAELRLPDRLATPELVRFVQELCRREGGPPIEGIVR
jgi:hypothetical protein